MFPVLAYAAIILGTIGAAVYLFIHYFGNIPLFLSGKLRLWKTFEVSRPAAEFPGSRKPRPSLALEDHFQLSRLLENSQFDALNEKIDEYQKFFAEDFEKDGLAAQSFNVFKIDQADYEKLFLAWIDHSPRHYAPHLARAFFHYAQGWQSRGHKFASETSREQFEGMQKHFAQALQDIDRALSIKADLMPAHALLIGIHQAGGERARKVEAIERALQLFPRSVTIWSISLQSLEPRWGGSYPAMEDFAGRAEPYFDVNPFLSTLYGYIYYDQARIFDAQKKYADAVALYTRAMEYGDALEFYIGRAEAYHYGLDEQTKALDDVNRCIVLWPADADGYRLRSRIYFKIGSLEDSRDDRRLSIRLTPGYAPDRIWMEWASKNLVSRGHRVFQQDLEQAAQWYSHALEFDAGNSEAYYWRAVANYRQSRFEKARTDLDRAIEFNPRHFESVLLMDYVLLGQKDFDTIIAYWDRFLELEPTHARAYLERAGAYHHKGDPSKSRADLKRSCELGNAEACKRLETK